MKKLLAFTLITSLIASPVLAAQNAAQKQETVKDADKKKESKVWHVIKNYVLPGAGLICGFLVLRWIRESVRASVQSDIRPNQPRIGSANLPNHEGAYDFSYRIEPPVGQETPAEQMARIARSANFNGNPTHIQQQDQLPAINEIHGRQLFVLPSQWDQPYRNLVGVVITPAANGNRPGYHVVVPQRYPANDQGPLKDFLGWLQPELGPDNPLFRALAA